MSDPISDDSLDALLRQVPVPTGMRERLRDLANWPDLELEHALAEVPVPSTLSARLKQIPANQQLDQSLQAVETPDELASVLYPIAQASLAQLLQPVAQTALFGRWQTLLMPALASVLVLAISLAYAQFAWQTLAHVQHREPAAPLLSFLRPESEVWDALETPVTMAGHSNSASEETAPTLLGPESPYTKPETEKPLLAMEIHLPQLPSVEPLPAPPPQTLALAMQEFRQQVFSSPMLSARDVLELDALRVPRSRGIATPLVPGYDRAFLLRTSLHPPVLLTPQSALQQSLAPISLETESYDRARFLLSRGNKLKPEEIRTEDFLATLESGLDPVKVTTPVLTLAGGPSPFGPAGSRWLGLNLRTGATASRTRESTHLVVAVELSPRMVRSGLWDWLRTGLIESLERLAPADRLSVILVQREVLFESGPLERESRDWLTQVLPQKAPFNEPDTGLALQTALETALIPNLPCKMQHVMLITEGRTTLTSGFASQLRGLGASLKNAHLGITLAEVGGESSITPAAELIGQSLQATVRKVTTRRGLVHLLQQELHGDAAVTAQEARMMVRFNPEAVASYRLVGHEANAMAQIVTPATQVELHPGDESHLLFEFLPQPEKAAETAGAEKGTSEKTSTSKIATGKTQVLAECELIWVDPATGQQQTKVMKFTRKQLANRWEEEPYWLRQAVLTSEAAEWIRGSRLALREAGWNSETPTPSRLESLVRDLRQTTGNHRSLPGLTQLIQQLATLKK